MSPDDLTERRRQVQEAIEAPAEPLASVSSNESVRSGSGPGLSMLPYLTINDIIALRAASFEDLEDLEARILEVPEPAWGHVLELVTAGIVRPPPEALTASDGDAVAGENGQA
ncbi:MAG: hypothetical protein R3185_08185 [Candidatus Thermoplasmatota archaeon]|nr:hypothetical protein [Candidatus Thermoplasmatota archaeon]